MYIDRKPKYHRVQTIQRHELRAEHKLQPLIYNLTKTSVPSTNANCSQTPVCVLYHYKARVSRTQPSPSHMAGKIQRFTTKKPIRIRRCIVEIRSHPTPLHTAFDLNGSDARKKVIECKKRKIVEKVNVFVNTKKHDRY